MNLQLKTAPAITPIDTTDAKLHLRVSNTANDTFIGSIINAAADLIDGPVGTLRRALITQHWYLKTDCWPKDDFFVMPIPPLQSITAITYYDRDNALQTLDASAYHVTLSSDGAGRVERVEGQTWPTVYNRPDAIIVEFIAGYGDAETDVPDAIRHALRLYVADMFMNRGDNAGMSHLQVNTGARVKTYNQVAADRLLARYVWPGAGR